MRKPPFLHAGGRRFKSCIAHSSIIHKIRETIEATSVAFVVSKTHHTLAKIHNVIGKLIGKQISIPVFPSF